MKNILFTGSIPALTTPFAQDESIALADWKKWVTWHDAQASRAVVLFGSTGEGVSLSLSERELLLKSARNSLQATAMIVGVSCPSTETATVLAKQAKDCGAQAILLTTPYYVKPDQNGLCQHYLKVAQAVKMPIILYTVPSRTGVDFSEKTLLTLCQNQYIVGIKDASSDLERMRRVIEQAPSDFIYLGGNDNEIFDCLGSGGDGLISVIANIVPNLMQSIISNYSANPQWSKGSFANLAPLIQHLQENGNPQVIKHMVQSVFSISSYFRLPLTSVDDAVKSAIESSLSSVGINPEEISA